MQGSLEASHFDFWYYGCSNHRIQRGCHNIEDELIFQSNPRFIFHDSRGFESGSVKELDQMKKFLVERTREMELGKRLHTIWWAKTMAEWGIQLWPESRFCISMTDYERPILAAEEKFFNECNTAAGEFLLWCCQCHDSDIIGECLWLLFWPRLTPWNCLLCTNLWESMAWQWKKQCQRLLIVQHKYSISWRGDLKKSWTAASTPQKSMWPYQVGH